jgi:hypothetical protein
LLSHLGVVYPISGTIMKNRIYIYSTLYHTYIYICICVCDLFIYESQWNILD